MSRVFSVQFTPGQENEFLSGGWDDTVQVIQIPTDSQESGMLTIRPPNLPSCKTTDNLVACCLFFSSAIHIIFIFFASVSLML